MGVRVRVRPNTIWSVLASIKGTAGRRSFRHSRSRARREVRKRLSDPSVVSVFVEHTRSGVCSLRECIVMRCAVCGAWSDCSPGRFTGLFRLLGIRLPRTWFMSGATRMACGCSMLEEDEDT